jgi:hypothetical protein
LSAEDPVYHRMAILLLHNSTEVALRSAEPHFVVPTGMEPSNRVQLHCKYQRLLDGLLQYGRIGPFQHFFLGFMHRARNLFYHEGYPTGAEYVICGKSLLGPLAHVYLNVACDLVVTLCECGLSVPIGEYRARKELLDLRFDGEGPGSFHGAVAALLDFYKTKFTVLTDMLVQSMASWGNEDPDDAMRRLTFWQGRGSYDSFEAARKGLMSTQLPVRFKAVTQVLDDILLAVTQLLTYVTTPGQRQYPEREVVQRLTHAAGLLEKYEKIVRRGMDARIEIRVTGGGRPGGVLEY